jgi:hypothetical protein
MRILGALLTFLICMGVAILFGVTPIGEGLPLLV